MKLFSIINLKHFPKKKKKIFGGSCNKDKCQADKSETIDILKDNIRVAIGEIQLHTIGNMLTNWTDRVGYSMTSRGSHLNEIIFHYLAEGLYFQRKKEILENIQEFF